MRSTAEIEPNRASLPLTGTVVLDLSDEAVALGSRLLADLGADVVRVEDAAGDWLRQRGPFVGDEPGIERSLAHILYNAGKRSLAVDFERTETWDILSALAERSDVIIAPLQKSERLRTFIEPESLARIAPTTSVVYPVFRRHTEEQVTDLIGIAAGGQLYLNGYQEDPPNHPAGNLAYKQLSLASAFAAMSLILERDLGNPPGRIEVSMQEAVMTTTIQSANENYWHWHQARPTRHGLGSLGGQTVFQARDGLWLSFYHHPPAWPAAAKWIAEALGDESFLAPEWEDGLYRFHHVAEVTEVTARLCATMDRADFVAEAQRRAILVVPVQGVSEIASDPHLRERDFFQRIWFEQLGAELEVIRAPFVSTAYEIHARPAPALGQHSREILRDFGGMDAATIDKLIETGVVKARVPEGAHS
jgi:crotonobetainyl-CoA:carnitine CoA-transferase CaiB-like acyl-CoA transferase